MQIFAKAMLVVSIGMASFFFGTVGQDPDLGPLLEKSADYCRKLEGAAFDFICSEEIIENFDFKLDIKEAGGVFAVWTSRFPRKVKRTYVYDYQCVRVGGKMTEKRTLLQEDWKKRYEPEAKLKTAIFVYGSVLLCPVGILGKRFQSDYDYEIAGQDRIRGMPVVIVGAAPKPGAPETTNLFGKAWIEPKSGDILKIEWSESRVGHREVFDMRGERYNLKPRITLTSEFAVEKNGLRFPSRLVAEEAYVNDGGRSFVRSTTAVTYKDFKFFTVEVDVR